MMPQRGKSMSEENFDAELGGEREGVGADITKSISRIIAWRSVVNDYNPPG